MWDTKRDSGGGSVGRDDGWPTRGVWTARMRDGGGGDGRREGQRRGREREREEKREAGDDARGCSWP